MSDTYRWSVDDQTTADAIAESAKYLKGVDVDAALQGFEANVRTVLDRNARDAAKDTP
jgi:hypothetical protein